MTLPEPLPLTTASLISALKEGRGQVLLDQLNWEPCPLLKEIQAKVLTNNPGLDGYDNLKGLAEIVSNWIRVTEANGGKRRPYSHMLAARANLLMSVWESLDSSLTFDGHRARESVDSFISLTRTAFHHKTVKVEDRDAEARKRPSCFHALPEPWQSLMDECAMNWGWGDPGLLMTLETIAQARGRSERDDIVSTWLLFESSTPGAVRFFARRRPGGTGQVYPDPQRASYLRVDPDWQDGLERAWNIACGGRLLDFDICWWIEKSPCDSHSSEDGVNLKGPSATAAIACAFLALIRREGLRSHVAISANIARNGVDLTKIDLARKLAAPELSKHNGAANISKLVVARDQDLGKLNDVVRVSTLEEAYRELVLTPPLHVTMDVVLRKNDSVSIKAVNNAMGPVFQQRGIRYMEENCSRRLLAESLQNLLPLCHGAEPVISRCIVHAWNTRESRSSLKSRMLSHRLHEVSEGKDEGFSRATGLLVTHDVLEVCGHFFTVCASQEWDRKQFFSSRPMYQLLALRQRPAAATLEAFSDAYIHSGNGPAKCIAVACRNELQHDHFSWAAQEVLRRTWPSSGVIFCEGQPARNYDLLGCFVEPLRDILNLNRCAKSYDDSADGELVTQRQLLQHSLKSSLDELYQGQCPSGIRQACESLLLGGQSDGRQYENLGDALFWVLERYIQKETAGRQQRFCLVATRFDQFDAASANLLKRLYQLDMIDLIFSHDEASDISEWTEFTDTKPIRWAELSPVDESYRLPSLSPEANRLLTIAAALGPDSLLSWLRWLALDDREPAEASPVNAEFEELERAGILRTSSRLADVSGHRVYREYRFASHSALAATSAHTDKAWAAELRRRFANILLWRLDPTGDESIQRIEVNEVRRKVVVCYYLGDCPEDLPRELHRFMRSMWTIIADRALSLDPGKQSIQRVAAALRFTDSSSYDPMTDRKLATVGMLAARSVNVKEDRDILDRLENFAKQQVDSILANKAVDPADFKMLRSYWAYQQASGNSLSEAVAVAEGIADWCKQGKLSSSSLDVETHHMLAVSLFGLGRLRDAQFHAHEGFNVCRRGLRGFDDTRPLDSHCGGGCCKVHAAVLEAIITGLTEFGKFSSEAARFQRIAFQYSDSIGEVATQVLARSYWALTNLLAGKFAEGMQFSSEACLLDGNIRRAGRWRKLAEINGLCNLVALDFERDVKGEILPFAFRQELAFEHFQRGPERAEETRRKLEQAINDVRDYGKDFQPLWMMYLAIANYNVQGSAQEAASDSNIIQEEAARYSNIIQEEIDVATDRGENVYIPEMLRWKCVLLTIAQQFDQARLACQEGIQLSKQMGAKLFRQRLEALERTLTETEN